MSNYDDASDFLLEARSNHEIYVGPAETQLTLQFAQVAATLALADAIRDITKVTVTQHDVHTDLTGDLMGLARDGAQEIIGRRLARLMNDDLEPMARHD